MRNNFFMQSTKGDVLDIIIYGDITSWEWYESDVSSYTLSKLIQQSSAKEIRIRINSYGGEVAEGLAIHNALVSHPARVVTECDGFACSAASFVFMAGDERLMHEASLLMIHNAWTNASGNAKELRKAAEDLEKISVTAASTYKSRINISEEELNELLENESWIEPQEAVDMGFATGIIAVAQPERQQYSAKGKIFEQLISEKPGKEPKNKGQMDEKDGFRKLFDKFIDKEGRK